MKRLWAPWRMAYVGGDHLLPDCFLCSAVACAGSEGAGEAHLVEMAPLTATLLNRYPYSSGHVMVVPRRHVADVVELTGEETQALMEGAQRAVAALRRALRPSGFNLGLNLGTAAGASAEHVHLHVVPRWEGDTNFMPVVGDVKVLPEDLASTAERLRASYAAPDSP